MVLVLYVLSFGPACWLCERHVLPQELAWASFRPLTWLARRGPVPMKKLISYAAAFGDRTRVEPVFEDEGHLVIVFKGMRRMPGSVSPIDYEFTCEKHP